MAPPPALPSLPALRPPLPSLQLHRQSQRGAVDVAPLRQRIAETVAVEPNKRSRDHLKEDTSADDTARDDTAKPKKPKAKEEREDLAGQIRALEMEIDALRRRAGLPTAEEAAAVQSTADSNEVMEEAIQRRDSQLGRLQSMVTNEMLLPRVNPMSTFIHLPKDMAQRHAILRSIQDLKLRRGIEFATSWTHHLDHSVPYSTEETFTSQTGEYHFHRVAIEQFPNFRSARELYTVFLDFLYNLEVSVTETFGQLAVREEVEDFDPTIWNHRIVTVADDVGCTEELNIVGFAKFYEYSPQTNSPMGVIVRDTVNIDDLYPYLPDERTCKDVQCVSLIFELPKPGTNETVVVLKECSFGVQLPPLVPIAANAIKRLQENAGRWPKAYMKYLHEYIVPRDQHPDKTDEEEKERGV